MLSGVITNDDEYCYGNPTFFIFPKPLQEKMHHVQDSLFDSLSIMYLLRAAKEENLIDFIIEGVQTKISDLTKKFKNGDIVCQYKVMVLSDKCEGYDAEAFNCIKELNANQIDWSNIPDYMTNKEFLALAEQCCGDNTIHTCNFMNWPSRVFGTHLFDYLENAGDEFKKVVGEPSHINTMAKQLDMKGMRTDMIYNPIH